VIGVPLPFLASIYERSTDPWRADPRAAAAIGQPARSPGLPWLRRLAGLTRCADTLPGRDPARFFNRHRGASRFEASTLWTSESKRAESNGLYLSPSAVRGRLARNARRAVDVDAIADRRDSPASPESSARLVGTLARQSRSGSAHLSWPRTRALKSEPCFPRGAGPGLARSRCTWSWLSRCSADVRLVPPWVGSGDQYSSAPLPRSGTGVKRSCLRLSVEVLVVQAAHIFLRRSRCLLSLRGAPAHQDPCLLWMPARSSVLASSRA
jgi:hypothetical protein